MGLALPATLAATGAGSAASAAVDTTATTSAVAGDRTARAAGCVRNRKGIPGPGKTYLGAAVSGRTDLPTRERQLDTHLRLHRTYYQSTQIDGAVRNAKADLAAGRLPWDQLQGAVLLGPDGPRRR